MNLLIEADKPTFLFLLYRDPSETGSADLLGWRTKEGFLVLGPFPTKDLMPLSSGVEHGFTPAFPLTFLQRLVRGLGKVSQALGTRS